MSRGMCVLRLYGALAALAATAAARAAAGAAGSGRGAAEQLGVATPKLTRWPAPDEDVSLMQLSASATGSRAAAGGAPRWRSGSALRAFQELAFEDGEDCPTTYLYDIPELWDLPTPMSQLAAQGWEGIGGKDCGQGMQSVSQFDMPEIVLYRLLTSKRCRITTDPEKADLFMVPYLPRPKIDAEWCPRSKGGVDPTPYLTHLSERTAHRHVFLFGKGHMAMAPCNPWFAHPTNLLRRAIRVTYSMPARGYPRPGDTDPYYGYGPLDARNVTLEALADLMGHFDDDAEAFPHTFSVPYPSTGVLGATPVHEPWKDFSSSRPVLAYYVGRTHGLYGKAVRRKIVEDCSKVGRHTCLAELDNPVTRCQELPKKGQAYFCLEPGGDSPNRKSLWDSISLGCVPVLFSPHQQILAPWHWGHFRNSSSVYINREDYLSGKVDLFRTLEEVAASGRLAELRKSIAAHGHSTQYARHDYAGDGFERVLIGAHHAALRHEQRRPSLE